MTKAAQKPAPPLPAEYDLYIQVKGDGKGRFVVPHIVLPKSQTIYVKYALGAFQLEKAYRPEDRTGHPSGVWVRRRRGKRSVRWEPKAFHRRCVRVSQEDAMALVDAEGDYSCRRITWQELDARVKEIVARYYNPAPRTVS
jgi:hypothetical protein